MTLVPVGKSRENGQREVPSPFAEFHFVKKVVPPDERGGLHYSMRESK